MLKFVNTGYVTAIYLVIQTNLTTYVRYTLSNSMSASCWYDMMFGQTIRSLQMGLLPCAHGPVMIIAKQSLCSLENNALESHNRRGWCWLRHPSCPTNGRDCGTCCHDTSGQMTTRLGLMKDHYQMRRNGLQMGICSLQWVSFWGMGWWSSSTQARWLSTDAASKNAIHNWSDPILSKNFWCHR